MRPSRLVRIASAVFLPLIVIGCSKTSPSAGLRPVPIPVLDSEASTPCPDPGVDRNPKVAVVEHRRALAICEERRDLAATAYQSVRAEFGVKN
jgi:hypothetical protein